jgi:hypothetical protein
LDDDALSTLCQTFLAFFLLVCVVGGDTGWGCGSPYIPLSIVTLMDHEALPFPKLEFEEYVVDPDPAPHLSLL